MFAYRTYYLQIPLRLRILRRLLLGIVAGTRGTFLERW